MKNFSLLLCLLISLGMMGGCSKKNNVTTVQTGGQSHDQQQSKPASQATITTPKQDVAEVVALHPVVVGNHFGFINDTGQMVIQPTFEYAFPFADGLAMVVSNGLYGYIAKDGQFAVKPQYQDGEDFSSGMAAVEVNGKWGYIDKTGALLVQPQFDYSRDISKIAYSNDVTVKQDFSDGFLVVQDGRLACHYVDSNSKRLTLDFPEQVASCLKYNENLAWVSVDYQGAGRVCERWRIIDRNGRSVSPILSVNPVPSGDFHDGLSGVFSCNEPNGLGLRGYVDRAGRFAIAPQFTFALDFSEGMAAVGSGSVDATKWGYIDTTGKVIVPLSYDLRGNFSDGMASVGIRESGKAKLGFVDKTGRLAVPLEFDYVTDFAEGVAFVGKDGLVGIIDHEGKWVLPPTFPGFVQMEGNLGVITTDESGKPAFIPSIFTHNDPRQAEKIKAGIIGRKITTTYVDEHGRQVWKSAPIDVSVFLLTNHL